MYGRGAKRGSTKKLKPFALWLLLGLYLIATMQRRPAGCSCGCCCCCCCAGSHRICCFSVFGIRYIRYTVFGIRYLVFGFRFSVFGIQFQCQCQKLLCDRMLNQAARSEISNLPPLFGLLLLGLLLLLLLLLLIIYC